MNTKPAKIAGLISVIAGVVLLLAGIATYAVVADQLGSEKITVAAIDAKNPSGTWLVGSSVNNPFSAYMQIEAIKHHALAASEGKTYAELGALAAKAKADGDQAAADKFTAQRTTVMNGSFLRASLFTSIVSFGIAVLVMGLGVMFLLIGWAFMALDKVGARVDVAEPARV